MEFVKKNILYLAWFQALAATLGSLFFSEVLKFPPCILCWYQRILMYPLVWIIAAGILRKDKHLAVYVLPLSVLGMLIAFYHNLLYYSLIPESQAPCTLGISCTTRFIEFLGFMTIPFLSFMAFLVITVSMVIYAKSQSKQL